METAAFLFPKKTRPINGGKSRWSYPHFAARSDLADQALSHVVIILMTGSVGTQTFYFSQSFVGQ